MLTKGIIFEDFVNYKVPCMTIEMPFCDFKCDKEYGESICQNCELASSPLYNYNDDVIIQKYCDNRITRAICFQGLEPFDTFEDMYDFIFKFRNCFSRDDEIVIYTGYNKEEIKDQLDQLKQFSNIIIKFGRYIPM